MWYQFILENLHFAVNSLVALIMLLTAWLYYDAFSTRHSIKEGFKLIGFGLLAISFVLQATVLDTNLLNNQLFNISWRELLIWLCRVSGYLMIIFGLMTDPLQPRPKTVGLSKLEFQSVSIYGVNLAILPVFPLLAALTGLLYWRRATIGLENHLKRVGLGFFVLSLAELLQYSQILNSSSDLNIYQLVAPFGPAWISQLVLLALAALLIGSWTSSYLLKRLQSQLFMIFSITTLVIFLLTSVTFTYLLVNNLQEETLSQLEIDAKVLDLAITSKQAETLSNAQVVATNPSLQESLVAENNLIIAQTLESFLIAKNQSSLVVVDENGQVVGRGEDHDRVGEALSGDIFVKKALLGQSVVAKSSSDGSVVPVLSVKAAVPINVKGKVVGAVVATTLLDSAFLENVKKSTNLEASLYAGKVVSSTTLNLNDKEQVIGPDSVGVGLQETNPAILSQVLTKGQAYTGSTYSFNRSLFSSYIPLKDLDNETIGMVAVARHQSIVLQTASRSIEVTFMISALLLALSIIPSFIISRKIAHQLR